MYLLTSQPVFIESILMLSTPFILAYIVSFSRVFPAKILYVLIVSPSDLHVQRIIAFCICLFFILHFSFLFWDCSEKYIVVFQSHAILFVI
jgi:hypothetical protein